MPNLGENSLWNSFLTYEQGLAPLLWGVGILAIISIPVLWFSLRKTQSRKLAQAMADSGIKTETAQEKYSLLLAENRIGVFEWLKIGDPRMRMVWSSCLYEILGFQPNSFEPTVDFLLSLVHPEDRPSAEKFLKSPLTLESESLDYRIRVLDQYRWFKFRNLVKRDGNGNPVFVLGSIEDIEDQKKAEMTLNSVQIVKDEVQKRTDQLRLQSHAKTRFLANASHEMRAPLGLILGFSELLSENKCLDSDARDYVELIQKNGEILSRIINDLLDLSKIEAGKLRFQYSRLAIGQLIVDLEKGFKEKAAKKGLSLSFQNFCSESESVVTDEIRLKQVLYNLLSNALKFTDKGGIHVAFGKRSNLYCIDIVDTGIGIPEEEKRSVFDEFARGEIGEAGKRVGVGLGLRLGQSMAQALGGGLDLVSSQVGRGSHFRLTFQSDELRLQKQTERRQDLEISSKLSDFDVFVLDDNEDNIRLAAAFLKKLGCRVRGFSTAKSLFAEMASSQPDLILLDINMPEMNGFEVFSRLRQSGYKKPIWALTAYSLNEDIQAILDHGFDDYVRKPMSLESMKRKLTFELRERSHD